MHLSTWSCTSLFARDLNLDKNIFGILSWLTQENIAPSFLCSMTSISFAPQTSLYKRCNGRDVAHGKEERLILFFSHLWNIRIQMQEGRRQKGCNMCRKMKLFSEKKKTLEFCSTERYRKSKGSGKDKWEEEFLLIKSVTGKYLHLEVKLRQERECLATHILFPHKFQFHCLCMQHSPGTRLLFGWKTSHSFPFLQIYLYHPDMHTKSFFFLLV